MFVLCCKIHRWLQTTNTEPSLEASCHTPASRLSSERPHTALCVCAQVGRTRRPPSSLVITDFIRRTLSFIRQQEMRCFVIQIPSQQLQLRQGNADANKRREAPEHFSERRRPGWQDVTCREEKTHGVSLSCGGRAELERLHS